MQHRNMRVGDRTVRTVNGVTVRTQVVKVATIRTGNTTGMVLDTDDINRFRAAIARLTASKSTARTAWETARAEMRAWPRGAGRRAAEKRTGEELDAISWAIKSARSDLEWAVRVANPGRPEIDINTALREL